ncbi:hypothetical protein Bbelb_380670 [Branchiostoma belcheri]|nr:hypothetical protein Bbelb_380670 [Branchiostoma belcheri]
MGQTPSKPAAPKLPATIGERFKDKEFPFENLVLEGGGAKGIAYIGACKFLEDAGIMPQIKRFAGTSAGAITATLLAIGLTSEEMLKELSEKNLLEVVLDTRWTKMAWIPGMANVGMFIDVITARGACPGHEFMNWFGDILDRHLKKRHPSLDKDVTFDQELCIVAYNMNFHRESFFHVKTTPLVRVREAVRMSMSIPVAFQPYELGNIFTYIDGGLAANFPLYAFDGWYLSMDEQDTFYKRLTLLSEDEDKDRLRNAFYPEYRMERFKTEDQTQFAKTLGILIFSNADREVYQDQFEARLRWLTEKDPSFEKERPETKKAREFEEQYELQRAATDAEIKAFDSLIDDRMKTLIDMIDRPEEEVIGGSIQITTEDDVKLLQVPTKEAAFKLLFLDINGQLTADRVLNMYQNHMPLQSAKRKIFGMRSVKSAKQYYGSLQDFVGSKNQLSKEDIDRCIAVDVDYLSTMDFDMTPTDMEFIMKRRKNFFH